MSKPWDLWRSPLFLFILKIRKQERTISITLIFTKESLNQNKVRARSESSYRPQITNTPCFVSRPQSRIPFWCVCVVCARSNFYSTWVNLVVKHRALIPIQDGNCIERDDIISTSASVSKSFVFNKLLPGPSTNCWDHSFMVFLVQGCVLVREEPTR